MRWRCPMGNDQAVGCPLGEAATYTARLTVAQAAAAATSAHVAWLQGFGVLPSWAVVGQLLYGLQRLDRAIELAGGPALPVDADDFGNSTDPAALVPALLSACDGQAYTLYDLLEGVQQGYDQPSPYQLDQCAASAAAALGAVGLVQPAHDTGVQDG